MDSPYRNIDQFIDAFVATVNLLPTPWGLKDATSRHLYMNKAARLYTGTPANFLLEGKSDSEFPTRWNDCADQFLEHDQRVKVRRDCVTVIETHYWYGKNYLMPFISDKYPIFGNRKQLLGYIWNARPVDNFSTLSFIDSKKVSVMTTQLEHPLFTPAELDVIFLLLRRFNVKEIARIYNLSVKTVSNRITTLYQKAGVHSLQQFEGYCRAESLENYLPERFLSTGVIYI
ncbi:helix-turn-helix transcriptional regulator [Pantoea sp. Bo_2]|uniref:Helix-turn-helix transcriptional regulator n=1 Tax=Candidatus Pantoea gossypiicola TaxID=2608008 RepID=A0AB34CRM8_9GAMM|nr:MULTISPECIES: PAS and helix-turn-helix domain-containing protein [Pantoea]KAA5930895.1 helix-turn-helix transcriptional regulator [Pantoea sp. VH_8]KAA5935562.1 helix-turn-helix transcriptional regulator [Pantoea sp. VH_4]KAA5948680.1 helix-turn-helix transcriptional regulator [Pantoea sp. VH_3]KAA5955063.1 helix-turn-helix transcriptional regulator [Pantoea sp. VH_25]KAA5957531.1 helix-turn-helix transcriptional regulator [Pantoea sp. VH_24]